MSLFGVMHKLSEAYDLRHQQVQSSDGLLQTFMDKTNWFKGINMIDAKRFLSLSTDNTVKLWDRFTGKMIYTFHATSEHHDTKINDVAIIDDNTIATITDFKRITVFDLQNGAIQHNTTHPEGVSKLAVVPGGQYILTDCGDDGAMKLWSRNLDLLGDFSLNNKDFRDCHVELIVCLSEDEFVAIYAKNQYTDTCSTVTRSFVLWDLMQEQSAVRSFQDHTDTITCATKVSLQSFLTGSLDGPVRWWDASTGECLKTFSGHSMGVTDVAVCTVGDGQRFVSGSQDGTARIWDAAEGSCIHTFCSIRGRVRSVEFVANGDEDKILISDDWCISCWSLEESKTSASTISEMGAAVPFGTTS
eukprot:CAMPEP_0194319910 /NCGR_PEP_ID=MMETSP0171-20130528/16305_1 /TAXON_ID=218684 /ORGANISM="Corethron pennatum, Strain L29A3" /LENGTH=358 /DNA_ID=CAMNT_0039077289 /DNA_START=734 /DNA_END=1810 /DNA_ORIENTATION=-